MNQEAAWEEGDGVEEGSTSGVSTINSNKSLKEPVLGLSNRAHLVFDSLNYRRTKEYEKN